MLYKNYTEELIGLEGVIVTSVKSGDKFCHIGIEMKRKKCHCPICNCETDQIHDYRNQKVKDISCFGKHTILHIRKRRYICCNCGKRFPEYIPFLPRYHRETSRLFASIIEGLQKVQPMKAVAETANLSQTTVARIFDKVSYGHPILPKVLSFDEFRGNAGGEKFQFIMTDPEGHKVLDILPTRKQEDLYAYFSTKNRKDVKYVVTDMNKVYRDVALACFPKATLVIDKYHVVRQVTWAFERVRVAEQKKFNSERRKYFKRSRTLLLKNPKKLKGAEVDQVAAMLKISERLRAAYMILIEFYKFMESKNSDEARKALGKWMMMRNYDLPEFESCFKTMMNWHKYILNAFDCPFTNGYTEGVNNKIKVIKRNAYGVRNFTRFRNRILHVMEA